MNLYISNQLAAILMWVGFFICILIAFMIAEYILVNTTFDEIVKSVLITIITISILIILIAYTWLVIILTYR